MPVRALPMHRQGGLEYHTLDLANALIARGHQVVLLTTAMPPQSSASAGSAAVVRHVEGSRPGDYNVGFFRQVPREIAKLQREFSFDVVHAQDFAGLLLRDEKTPFLVTVHGTLTSETPLDRRYMRHLSVHEKLKALWRYKSRLALRPWFTGMLRQANALIVDSEFTRRELLLQCPDLRPKIHEVPLGLDQRRYPFSGDRGGRRSAGGAPVIALLGRMQEMKGIRQALLAASGLKQRGVDFHMRIAGTGDFAAEASRVVADLGISDCVELTGRVSDEQLPEFLQNSDLFLFPDLTQPAFGLVAVEAMRYGLPVIGARSGAIPEVVDEQSGWLYDPWDVEGLTVVLARALGDAVERSRRSSAAQTRAAEFNSMRMAEQVEAVYRRIL